MWLNFRHLRKVELSQKVNCSYLNTCIFNHLFQLELGTGDSTVNVLHLSPCVSTFFAAGPLHRVFVLSSRHADSENGTPTILSGSNPGFTAPQLAKRWYSAEDIITNFSLVRLALSCIGIGLLRITLAISMKLFCEEAEVIMVASKLHLARPQRSVCQAPIFQHPWSFCAGCQAVSVTIWIHTTIAMNLCW